MKKSIMQTAWQIFRTTGKNFAECLKSAWANFKLKKAMQTKIVEFHFKKVDGSIRQAFGRLFDVPETKGERKQNENLFTYFDTVANAWRSFYKFNLQAFQA